VQHQGGTEPDPLLLRDDAHQVLLDLLQFLLDGQAEALADAGDVGIDDDTAGDAEGVGEDDVGRLTGDAGQGGQLLNGARHLAAEVLDEGLAGVLNGPGLVAVEAGRPEVVLQLGERGLGEGAGVGVLGEQAGGDLVDALVGGLGGEDGGHEQLQGRVPVELVACVGVLLPQAGEDGGQGLKWGCHGHALPPAARQRPVPIKGNHGAPNEAQGGLYLPAPGKTRLAGAWTVGRANSARAASPHWTDSVPSILRASVSR
jgi:hypothetical protein